MGSIIPLYSKVELIDLQNEESSIRIKKTPNNKVTSLGKKSAPKGVNLYKKVMKINRGQVNLANFKVDGESIVLEAQTPITDRNGVKIAILSITMDFTDTFSSLNLKKEQIYDYFVFNSRNQLLVTNFDRKEAIPFKSNHELDSFFDENQNIAKSDANLYLRSPIYFSKYNPNYAIEVLLVTNRTYFNQFIMKEIIDELLAFAIILAVSLIISFYYIRSITKPLRILKKLSHKLDYSNSHKNILNLDQLDDENLDHDHEITQLTESLIMMSRHIVSQNKQLELQQKALDLVSLVAITDTDGVIFNVNQKYCNASGFTKSELLGTQLNFLSSNTYSKGNWSA